MDWFDGVSSERFLRKMRTAEGDQEHLSVLAQLVVAGAARGAAALHAAGIAHGNICAKKILVGHDMQVALTGVALFPGVKKIFLVFNQK